ncbi:MAG: hypothetical protein ACRBN8_42225 [Nannocystales bacterium]
MKSHLLLFLGVCACADPLLAPEDTSDPSPLAPLQAGMPEPAPCVVGPANPTTLVVTTTDFATGAVTVVDADGTVRADVAVGSPDAVPYASPQGAAIVHRHGYDFVDMLDAGAWRSRGQHALDAADAVSPNPHAIAFDDEGLGYVTLFGSSDLLVFDASEAAGESVVDTIDLSPFADEDGRPEASTAVRCGDTLWVGVQRLDVPGGYTHVDEDMLIAVDLPSRVPWDFDADTAGGQGVSLQGTWLRQLRPNHADPSTVFGLTTGIERIDLGTFESTWAVSPDALAAVGASHHDQPLAFDVDASGQWAWLALYLPAEGTTPDCSSNPQPCFDHARLFEVDLLAEPPTLVPFGAPFQAVDRTVQRIGETLWVGSRETEAPGLYAYDLTSHPPSLTAGPISTGLPPYSLIGLDP